MQLVYDTDQTEFRDTVRAFLAARAREPDLRRVMETDAGIDPELWSQMATQLELPGLVTPEEHGGGGYGPRELALVFEELGASLACVPMLSSVALATQLLLALDAGHDLLARLATGDVRAAVAWLDGDADGDTLTGSCDHVVDGATADVILVVAGDRVYEVQRSDAAGVQPITTLDLTRRLASVTLDGTAARLLAGDAGEAIERALDLATVALAAEQVGGAQRALDMSVEYAKERVQFGRPIGSFQAIKHRLADLLADVELARSAVYYAAWVAAEAPDELPLAASLATVRCSEAFLRATEETIQVHGGIGFTWEHPAHLYFKRAKSSQLLLRPPAWHRARLGALILDMGRAPA